jgi:hypothetical protein
MVGQWKARPEAANVACMDAMCTECGATTHDGESCRDCFDALLAYENERPAAFGAVHHLTVACYFLQHPSGYGPNILLAWHELLDRSIKLGEPATVLQQRMGRRFSGSAKVRDANAAVPAGWPCRWTVNVHDVLRPDERLPIDDYITRARTWATATLATLDAAQVTGWIPSDAPSP